MIPLRLLPALAAALLLAAPAAAQSNDTAVSQAMIATIDLCLEVMKGHADWKTGLDAQGYATASNGGRVKPVGGALLASELGSNQVRGAPARICEITAVPQVADTTLLDSALRARSGALRPMGRGPIDGGAVMDGYADLDGTGLIVLAITDRPAVNGQKASTSISVIWK